MAPKIWETLPDDKRSFMAAAWAAAQASEKDTNVPTCITMAQAILESDWGSHHCGSGNNYFGIKADSRWSGPVVVLTTKEHSLLRGWYSVPQSFRAYPGMTESFTDHGRFLLNNRRYRSLFSLRKDNYIGWARGLQQAGYATDPGYANSLIAIITKYELYYCNLAPGA